MESADVRRGLAELIVALLGAGLDAAQLSRLADLRARARRGAYTEDGYGTVSGSPLRDRRLEFARWLVLTGRLHDGVPGPPNPLTPPAPALLPEDGAPS
jgi:hypothetical protein